MQYTYLNYSIQDQNQTEEINRRPYGGFPAEEAL